jgi:hypothetical protein
MRKAVLLFTAAAMVVFMAPASAGPLNGARMPMPAVGLAPEMQDVHWRRRCWWHRGHWHCSRHGWYRPRYFYGGGYPVYRRYHRGPRFGVWGPGFGFYVGPRHRYRW